MNKLISFFYFFIILLPTLQAQEQVLLSGESSYVKDFLLQFLLVNGDAESISDTTFLFTTEIHQIGKLKNDGVFSFGLMQSHSKEYIFLRRNGEIIILDPNNVNNSSEVTT